MFKFIKVINVLLYLLSKLTAWRFAAILASIIVCVGLTMLPAILSAAS